jgi:hypothetical protein
MADLTELRERLEKATGPDRALDVEIVVALGLTDSCPFWLHRFNRTTPMRLTGSVDDALALVERMLPERALEILLQAICDIGMFGMLTVPLWRESAASKDVSRLPRAILLALVTALEAQRDTGGE